jgi:hypothetical protein
MIVFYHASAMVVLRSIGNGGKITLMGNSMQGLAPDDVIVFEPEPSTAPPPHTSDAAIEAHIGPAHAQCVCHREGATEGLT